MKKWIALVVALVFLFSFAFSKHKLITLKRNVSLIIIINIEIFKKL